MKPYKLIISGFMIAIVLLFSTGCSDKSHYVDNNESNNTITVELGSEGFTGSVFSFILKGLANGMLKSAGSDVMGNFLNLLGWGDSGSNEEAQTLNDIDNTLHEISSELTVIEGELKEILTDIKVSEDSIKNDVDWPRDAVTKITTATQEMQLLGVDTKPGEGDHTKIANLAANILGAEYNIQNQVMSIYTAIEGNPTPLLSNYIDQVMLQLPYNDNENLQKAYQGFEYYTSELLNYQIKGVNLVIEAHKAQDDNSTAQEYLNCYNSDMYNVGECNILYKEIGDMDNKTSFIYNAVSMVLRDAPIYDPFLPTSAESIFKRAEFYRLLMTGAEHNKYGLHLFHISTADMEKSPDTLIATAPELSFSINCNASSRHIVTGRAYDFWEGNTVKASTDYNVVEYVCDYLPNGTYSIREGSGKLLGSAEVSQYDTNYDLNSSGTISYGFGLLTHNIANHFTESSDKWTIQKPSGENYYSSTSGSANDWPIKANASSKMGQDEYESNAHIELDGHFVYDEDAEERTMYVAYHAKFYTKAVVPYYTDDWGGDADSYFYVGVHDLTSGGAASDDCHYKSYYHLHASRGDDKSGHHYPSRYCSFTAKPGHHYFVYFKMIAKASATYDGAAAESELDTVYGVNIKFTR